MSLEADPIEGEDSSVFAARVRASVPLGARPNDARKDTLELELSHDRGEFTQDLAATESIQLDDERILGPAVVDAEFGFSAASVLYHRSVEVVEPVWLGWGVGIGATYLDLEVSSGAVSESDARAGFGPALNGDVAVELGEEFEVFSGLLVHYAFPETYATRLDVGLAWRPSRLQLLAGWHFGYVEVSDDSDDVSDVELRFRGPFVTLAYDWR